MDRYYHERLLPGAIQERGFSAGFTRATYAAPRLENRPACLAIFGLKTGDALLSLPSTAIITRNHYVFFNPSPIVGTKMFNWRLFAQFAQVRQSQVFPQKSWVRWWVKITDSGHFRAQLRLRASPSAVL